MKLTVKILTIAAVVLLATAAFVNAEPQDNNRPDGEKTGAPDMEFEHRGHEMEISDTPEDGDDRQATDSGRGMAIKRGRQKLHAIEDELMTWLTKNEPAEANSLAELKEKDPQAYMKKLSIDMKKYCKIVKMEETNPALAEVLKNELKLKSRCNELLEKFKTASDDKQKETIKAELKNVLGQTFDVKLQKKQIKYEELKKKLEKLQKSVNKSQAELDTFKNDKEAQVDKHLESIIGQSGQFDWD